MTSVVASEGAEFACIAGHGILIAEDFELVPGVVARPNPAHFELDAVAKGCESLHDYAAVLEMMELATFYLEIQSPGTGKELVVKTWNSLWLFHLLALACESPCTSLYSWCGSDDVRFSVAMPHQVPVARSTPSVASKAQLEWARSNLARFEFIQRDPTFTMSLLSFANSHYLFGQSSRIMLLWSGIECLFNVSTEITRTIAMYSALLLADTDSDARYERFKEIKKEYAFRSRVVHGTGGSEDELKEAYVRASKLLAKLLARCVELSHVPSTEELDRAALTGYISAHSEIASPPGAPKNL